MGKNKTASDNAIFNIHSPKVLGLQYFILSFFWLIFIALLVAAVVMFSVERARVNSDNNVNAILDQIANSNDQAQKTTLYKQLMDIKYPLIDFSLMTFVVFSASSAPVSDWGAAWTQRLNNINLAYSYIFITALIAIIGFVFYIIVIVRIYHRAHFEKRHGLVIKYHNDYVIYDIKMYLNFIVNLAIVFSFFNFLSTLVALAYGTILVLVSYFFWYVLRIKTEVLVKHKWWKAPNFALFAIIIIIQNTFNILKVVFANEFGVNLDLILSVLFPIGTITVMLTILIRNMLNTQVSAIMKAIKTINARVTAYRIFYYSQKQKGLEDYTFVTQLPTLIKVPFAKNAINTSQAYKLMTEIDEATTFFEQHYEKEKEKKYMLYHLFNIITDVAEIEEIKRNKLKLESQKAQKEKKKKKK
ncbi:hypothetical protein [Spiroplasma platyhelix]|uniref:Transmembrane protein n=1 Tax=Spiroplasma platyhelix PALS-1 TaxID=1276218 RepID=A0A846TPI6_9MOLU|nr:hypothetical protein [Spiroplasma platyhelix]MBE4703817.1 hypothetical protein [Spiroplasma platyhelix PALS-1]NKE38190.1 hypothetical protein [Spiroplasma platyhelix PALS-1]UJB29075.1 hypothetical protein SPLAT_v1c03110 [Spiroplasma platyhelix PALS-1]